MVDYATAGLLLISSFLNTIRSLPKFEAKTPVKRQALRITMATSGITRLINAAIDDPRAFAGVIRLMT